MQTPSGFVAGLVAGLVFATGTAGAQSFSWGIKGGVAPTGAVEGTYGVRSEAKRYTVDPTVEIGLPHWFALEVDALYRRTGYSTANSFLTITNIRQVRANSWESPRVAKYCFLRSQRLRGEELVGRRGDLPAIRHGPRNWTAG